MTESIQSILDEISQKARGLHVLLQEERQKNATLVEKINELQTEIEGKSAQFNDLETQMSAQEERLGKMTEQNSDSNVAPSLGRTQEIDELVKEIEYCIGQLRK